LHTNLGNIGYNCFKRYINDVQTPVIPICQGAQPDDPSAECSTESITFWTPGGRDTYDPLLVRANQRLSHSFAVQRVVRAAGAARGKTASMTTGSRLMARRARTNSRAFPESPTRPGDSRSD